MLQSEPAKRPSVQQLMQHPTIQLRLKERSMRDEYAVLKKKENLIDKRLEELKQMEISIKAREEQLREREIKA